MFPSRLCTIGFYILLNLCASNVLCQGQGQRMQHIAMSNGNIAYPENGEQDPDLQNAKVNWMEIWSPKNWIVFIQ